MEILHYSERPAHGEPEGLLILHHGRGSDDQDLLGVAEAIDRPHRFHIVSPRAPMTLTGWPGFHWYVVPRVGYPDHDTFHAAYEQLAALHEHLWEKTGIPPERTVLGGFSMGCVMSYATALGEGRPVPAGVLALSGFIPTVDGWEADLAGRQQLPVLIAHGRGDQVIPVQFAHAAHARLEEAGLPVRYIENSGPHTIAPAVLGETIRWLAEIF